MRTRLLWLTSVPFASTVLVAAVLATPPAAARTTAHTFMSSSSIDASSRASVYDAYQHVLEPALAVPIGWTGNASTCTPGTPSAAAQTATLTAVNFYRDLIGVPRVTFDDGLNATAQQAALMMLANNALSHNPPTTWKCYTDQGASGAGHSNLYLGVAGAAAIAGFMDDPGSGNSFVGHRRWITYPPETRMGSGSTSDSDALYVLDTDSWQTPASQPQWTSWPSAGYVPVQLEPNGRWSLSSTDSSTDFSQATVRVTRNGTALPVTIEPVVNGYGDPTLVWELDPGYTTGQPDQPYVVTVGNIVRGGVPVSYSYTTTLFDGDAATAPDRSQTITFATPGGRTYGDAVSTLSASASSGLPVSFSSSTPSVCSTGGTRGTALTVVGAGMCTVIATQAGDGTHDPAPSITRSFTVAKRVLTVTALDQTRPPGSPNAAVQVSYAGFASGETLASSGVTGAPSCSTTATAGSPAGTYPLTCATGSLVSAHYDFAFVGGTLTVSGGVVPIAPVRLLDTRNGNGVTAGRVPAYGTVRLQVDGRGGIPDAGVAAVALNVTVAAPAAKGYVTVYGGGSTRPGASTITFPAGVGVPGLVIAPVGADGSVELYNGSAGEISLVADASAYVGRPSNPARSGQLVPLPPARVLDTRSGIGAPAAQIPAGGTLRLTVAGHGGLPPSGVGTALLTVTAAAPAASGYLTVYAGGATRPAVSNVTFATGRTVANLVAAPVGADGSVSVYNGSTRPVSVVADVAGYVVAGSATDTGDLAAVAPARLLDTRRDGAPAAARHALTLQVTGRAGVPTGAVAAVLNVTVTAPATNGYLTAFAGGTAAPAASNLNFTTGRTTSNLVVVPVGADGTVSFYNGSGGTVQLVADVFGYVVG